MNSSSNETSIENEDLSSSHEDHGEEIQLWKWNVSYSRWIVNHPYMPIIFSVTVCIGLYAWLFTVYGIKVYADTNFYRWSGDDITTKWDAYTAGREGTYASLLDLVGQQIGMPRQFQLTQMGCVIYERLGQNILDVEAMQEIWKVEDEMHATPGWEDRCFRIPFDIIPPVLHSLIYSVMDTMKDQLSAIEPNYCIAFKSIFTEIKEYMTKVYNITDPKPEQMTQKMINDFINSDFERIYGTYIGNDFKDNSTTRIRSMFPFGLPYVGYVNKDDRTKEQTNDLGMWQKDFIKPVEKMQTEAPVGVIAYPAFPFALEFLISDVVLEQVYWLIGSFACVFLVSIVVMKSFFVSIIGTIGIFLPIPCAISILQGVFTIHHIDVIDVLGLFFICGIGADGLFIIFQMFKQSYHIYGPKDPVSRLAYANQRGLISVATALATAGISFLALCTSGVRIMRFFGVFCFLMLLFEFLFTFSFYLGVMIIWSHFFEKRQSYAKMERNDINLKEKSEENIEIEDSDEEETSDYTEVYDYPNNDLFAFMKYRPKLRINASGLNPKELTLFERFFLFYWTPIVYHYRFIIGLVFFVFSIVFGYFTFQMESKSELQFFNDFHPLQRAYSLALDGFSTALNDFSFVYVWGLKDKPRVTAADRMTITDYGHPRFWDNGVDVSDPEVQKYINDAFELLVSQDFIDATLTEQLGANPLQPVKQYTDFFKNFWNMSLPIPDLPIIGGMTLNQAIDALFSNINNLPFFLSMVEPMLSNESKLYGNPLTSFMKLFINRNNKIDMDKFNGITANISALYGKMLIDIVKQFVVFPTNFPVDAESFTIDEWIWQILLSMMTMSEPDSYVPGTLKANTIGFDKTNYSLRFISIKANMIIPEGRLTVEKYRTLYNKATKLAKQIDDMAPPSMKGGFMTSVAWNTMVTEEKLPSQVVLDVAYAFIVATIVIFICTLSPSTAIYTLYSMICTVFIILGILYLTGWKIGTNEAIMISIAAGFSIDFIIQPLIGLKSDISDRSNFGRLQNSLTTFSSPVFFACLTSILAAVFLYPCDVLLFPPFATFMIASSLFGMVHGFAVIPALVGMFGPRRSDSLVEIYRRKHPVDEFDLKKKALVCEA